ncbi:hypothetical protein [Actinokineospora sp. NBRC 105648]|uniref:hypothetical protein n=1 Tax=Actinokineospora sp. NBRC 105648 TaxID=3032206 RepID=UPI0024A11176|nr:hypothetical protein [Actinokineospora sp. NBRC 105648]GLZ39796.1 hypothetical protein Acsp05_34200 [Actinokineospora sp. NBRC 105648]
MRGRRVAARTGAGIGALGLLTAAVLVVLALWDFTLAHAGYSGDPGVFTVARCETTSDGETETTRCTGVFTPAAAERPTGPKTLRGAGEEYAEGTRVPVLVDGDDARQRSAPGLGAILTLLLTLGLLIAAPGGYLGWAAVTGAEVGPGDLVAIAGGVLVAGIFLAPWVAVVVGLVNWLFG